MTEDSPRFNTWNFIVSCTWDLLHKTVTGWIFDTRIINDRRQSQVQYLKLYHQLHVRSLTQSWVPPWSCCRPVEGWVCTETCVGAERPAFPRSWGWWGSARDGCLPGGWSGMSYPESARKMMMTNQIISNPLSKDYIWNYGCIMDIMLLWVWPMELPLVGWVKCYWTELNFSFQAFLASCNVVPHTHIFQIIFEISPLQLTVCVCVCACVRVCMHMCMCVRAWACAC